MRYAYLGPEGTFTEAALRSALGTRVPGPGPGPGSGSGSGPVCEPYPTVADALEAVRRGHCAAAMVPVENSLKGVVPATLDGFAATDDLHIVGETELRVSFALLGLPGATLDGVERVRSHPHALAQCGRWLGLRLPNAVTEAAASTAGAARDLARSGDPRDAAVAAPAVAERYGLRVLATDIGERENAVTRFVMVRRAGVPPARTGRDRTSLLVSAGDGTPAALPGILSVFTAGRVSLAWVQAWPTGLRLGDYRFFVDVEGHIDDQRVRHAVASLSDVGARASFLGSYPRAGARATAVTAATAFRRRVPLPSPPFPAVVL
ncbi:prephenate dehydratase [Streptomyces sp. NPDC003300]|uniref:prephenate dehydratase n=1 Tax=unclassified Streptomyces TaxID=2593676 RepID=UPI0033B56A39